MMASAQVVRDLEKAPDSMEIEAPDDRIRDHNEEKKKKKGHAKTNSVSEKDRKIGHRRINEEGQVSYKKVQTDQLMGSIQLGIQYSVGGQGKYPERDLLMQDFMTVENIQFPKNGGPQTPGHPYNDFAFKHFAPVAFRYFRDLFGIPRDEFLVSICDDPMRELSNPGASGSIFYLTSDDEFILKTVMLKEAEFLQKLLPGYYMNLNQNPKTLLPKFFGMYTYHANQKNIRLIVMNNILPSSIKMHLKFDLKGSTYKRKASKHEKSKKSPTYKDLDFMDLLPEGLSMEPDTYTALIATMRRDCRVLESFKIMDYSLLLGIHNLDQAAREKQDKPGEAGHGLHPDMLDRQKSIAKHKLVAHSTAMESIQATSDPVDIPEDLPPGGIPARNHRGERLLVFLGVIDILQSYQLKKKLEHTFKAMIHDGDTVSVHRPGFYAERFMNFMSDRVFRKIPSPMKHSPSKRTKRESIKNKISMSKADPETKNDAEATTMGGLGGSSPGAFRAEAPAATSHSGASSSQEPEAEAEVEQSQAFLPAVLRDRPRTSRGGGRGAPPPVPPRSPRRPHELLETNSRGESRSHPDVVPSREAGKGWGSQGSPSARRGRSESEVVSVSDIRLETRYDGEPSTPSHLSAAGTSTGRTPTPTWTEGTPSYTESTYSGDPVFPSTPARSLTTSKDSMPDKIMEEAEPSYHETEMSSSVCGQVLEVKDNSETKEAVEQ